MTEDSENHVFLYEIGKTENTSELVLKMLAIGQEYSAATSALREMDIAKFATACGSIASHKGQYWELFNMLSSVCNPIALSFNGMLLDPITHPLAKGRVENTLARGIQNYSESIRRGELLEVAGMDKWGHQSRAMDEVRRQFMPEGQKGWSDTDLKADWAKFKTYRQNVVKQLKLKLQQKHIELASALLAQADEMLADKNWNESPTYEKFEEIAIKLKEADKNMKLATNGSIRELLNIRS